MLNWSVLQQQDAVASSAVIEHFKDVGNFCKLAKNEGELILKRDAEDDVKLQAGIKIALDKGVIPRDYEPEPYITIDVNGKSPSQVVEEILTHCGDTSKGVVIVLCGLSGVGKGTTVSCLAKTMDKVHCWSNGNIFRVLTLLAATWAEQNGTDLAAALTPENLATFMTYISFGKFRDDAFDTRICGLGYDAFVSDICNTVLKEPKVAANIPTVAEVTQGEVINFAADAIKTMCAAGMSVLLEGREATVNFVRSPSRFILTISDTELLGRRRAAQRVMAQALKDLKQSQDEGKAPAEPSEEDIATACTTALEKM